MVQGIPDKQCDVVIAALVAWCSWMLSVKNYAQTQTWAVSN